MAAETETDVPPSVDLAEAVALMTAADRAADGERETDADAEAPHEETADEEPEDGEQPEERIEGGGCRAGVLERRRQGGLAGCPGASASDPAQVRAAADRLRQ